MAGSISAEVLRGGGPPARGDSSGEFGGRGGAQRRASLTGIFALLAAVTMLFAALTSALVVRRGLGDDWAGIPVPPILWWNTAALVVSSGLLEGGRRALRAGRREAFNRFWAAGTALGAFFLCGQYLAWRQVQAAGIQIATHPGGSFFYLLTVAHALHVTGGLAALLYIEVQALRLRLGPRKRTAVEAGAIYWHFMGGLWIYLMILFRFWG